MNEGIPFAERMLREYGEFLPFGVVMTAKGETQHVGAYDGREHPPSQDLITLMVDALRQEAEKGRYRAIAIFFDVKVQRPNDGKKVDAVQVGLEHLRGYCADVFFPYTLTSAGPEFGDTFASSRSGTVFGNCE